TTRSEIGRVTGLSRTAVTARVNQLIARGLLVERTAGGSTGGRPPVRLEFNTAGGIVLAASIGRSRTQLGVSDLGGELLVDESIELDHELGPEHCLPPVAERLLDLAVAAGRSAADVVGIGVSIPGTVDVDRGSSLSSIVLPSWDGIPLAPLLRPDLDVPVLVDRDVNVMAMAVRTGPLRDVRDLLMVKASTGIGAAVVSGGTLQRGDLHAAGELGHIPLRDGGGVLCRCGQRDCLEAVAGGWALVKALRAEGREVTHVRDVVRLALGGDPVALDMIRESGRRVGEVLSSAVTLLNPGVVVIGGDLASAYEPFVAGVRESVYGRSTALSTRQLRIVPSTYGDRIGLVGCVAMVLGTVLAADAVNNPRPTRAVAAH
ncbi:MAG TPA: ROK family protein, partial [Jatrophihabitantaceae bacterium]|nr:ROK family protein [Jatrophihabitantaceae bacterium]